MASVRLRYRRSTFIPTVLLLGLALVFLNAFFALLVNDVLSVFLAVLVSLVLFSVIGLSPLLTTHLLDDDHLELRQGWYFRGRIPIDNITSLECIDKGPFRTGVFFRLSGNALFVTTQRHGLFKISLREAQRFGFALGKRAHEVYFDTLDRDLLMKKLKERGITPSNQVQPSSVLA
ncbi:MAG: hypothetical protein QW520_01920 [Methanomassiliicoccales archaeon]